jgi:hypothetical protein
MTGTTGTTTTTSTPGGRLRALAATTSAVGLLAGMLVSGADPAAAADPVCDTETIVRAANPPTYEVTVCLVTPAAGDQLVDPVDVTATASVNDPAGLAAVQRVTFRWKPTSATTDTYLLADNDAEPGALYRMSLRSYRLPGTTGSLTARAVVDDDVTDGVTGATPVDATIDVTKDDETEPPTPPAFSPRLGSPGPGDRYTLAATGDGVDGSPQSHDVVQVIKGWSPDSFSYLGDVYTNGTAYEFDTWYGETGGYGELRDITNPAVGNHEYREPGAAAYLAYWGGVPRWYSYDVGGWHVAVLDTNVATDTGDVQTTVGSPQYQWLDADLAAHQSACTIVVQHQPRYAEAPGSRTYLQDLWSLAYRRGVTLLLAGHVHKYERWTPMDEAGNPVAGGLTQLVAGGGGREAVNPSTPDPRVAARGSVGALRLDLGADDLAFTYADQSGATVDQGSVPCRQRVAGAIPPPPDTTPPTTPAGLTATASSTTAAILSWQPASDAVGVASYVVRRNDAVVATVPGSTTSWRDGGLAPGKSYRWTVEAADAAGNRSAQSAPASATTPMPLRSSRRLLADLRTAAEHRAGWTSRRFPGWTDADGDRCRTPSEVLITEALTTPRVRTGCELRGGTWRSRYDGALRTGVGRLTVDHLVGLREAWESGASRWSRVARRQLANDLGYPSTLIAVTTASATAKGGREPRDWLPRKAFRCSYLSQWVAVKWRWQLAVDPSERRFLKARLSSCGWPSVRLPTRPRT